MVALRKPARKERRDTRPAVGLFAREMQGEDVVYTTRGATSWYQVTLKQDGSAECYDMDNKMPCPGFHYSGHCRHITACQKREQTIAPVVEAVAADDVEVDEEYEAWKKANGLTEQLSREAYIEEFHIY